MFAWRDNYISYNGEGGGPPPPSGDPYWTSVTFRQDFETPSIMYNDSSSAPNLMYTSGYARPNSRTPFTGATSNSVRIDTDSGGTNPGIVLSKYNSAWALGTQSWTAECWVYVNTLSVPGNLSEFMIINNGGGSYASVRVVVTNGGAVYLLCSGPGNGSWINNSTTSSGAITLNTWHHVAAVRNGNVFTLYINGVSRLTYNSSASLYNGSLAGYGETSIGNFTGNPSFSGLMNGYISNFRLVVGTAVYTSAFTPPTSPLTNITNTKLLLNMVGYGQTNNQAFTDFSNNGVSMTLTSTPRYSGLSPFSTTAPNLYPGSVYFNGSSLITAASNSGYAFGTGDFTIECWFYRTTASNAAAIAGTWTGTVSTSSWLLTQGNSNPSNIRWGDCDGTNLAFIESSACLLTNAWQHIAVVRQSSVLKIYHNGTQVYSAANTRNISLFPNLGLMAVLGGSYYSTGYLSNVRIVKGTAVYTTAFTPSTIPLTAITNTQFLLLPQTGGNQDLSNSRQLISNGTITAYDNNGQIQSITKKFGSQSLYYTGSGIAYQLVNDSTSLRFDTGDFTIEMWVNTTGSGATQGIIGKGTSTTGWYLNLNSSNRLLLTIDSTVVITGTTTIGTGGWNFIALSRVGNVFYLFVNSTSQGTYTAVANFNQTNNMYIGCNRIGSNQYSGYIDDVRITKGVGRYTTTCTVPTEAFPNS